MACAEPKGARQALVHESVTVWSQTGGLGGGSVGREWEKGVLYYFPCIASMRMIQT